MPKVTINKDDLPPINGESESYFTRFRIITDDRNNKSYWSPIYQIPVAYCPPYTHSATGTVGSLSGSGPWSGSITGLNNTSNLPIGSKICATDGTGSLGSGGTYLITAIPSNSSIGFSATGGTTPIAGTITNLKTVGVANVNHNSGIVSVVWEPVSDVKEYDIWIAWDDGTTPSTWYFLQRTTNTSAIFAKQTGASKISVRIYRPVEPTTEQFSNFKLYEHLNENV